MDELEQKLAELQKGLETLMGQLDSSGLDYFEENFKAYGGHDSNFLSMGKDTVGKAEYSLRFFRIYTDNTDVTAWSGTLDIRTHALYVLLGFSDGRYVRVLLDKMDAESRLLIYEPDEKILTDAWHRQNLTDILSDDRLYILCEGINAEHYAHYLSYIHDYESIDNIVSIVSPRYESNYGDELEAMVVKLNETITVLRAAKNTRIANAEKLYEASLHNLAGFADIYSIDALRAEIRKINICDAPAIIVGAGPSLDKNIENLKGIKDKAFIIATDSANNALIKRGIVPHVCVSVDVYKPKVLFETKEMQNVPLICTLAINPDIWDMHKGKKILFMAEYLVKDILGYFGKGMTELDTGGSVSCNAFSLARFLGFKNIVLIGHDLAFYGEKLHAKETYEKEDIQAEEGRRIFNERKTVKVKGKQGEELLTYENMDIYRRWFENEAGNDRNIQLIDATEGGVLIENSKIMTLRQVIDKYCERVFDFTSVFGRIKPLFSENQKKEYEEIYKGVEDKIESFMNGKENLTADYPFVALLDYKYKQKDNYAKSMLDKQRNIKK